MLHSHTDILHVGKFYPPHSGGMETHLKDLATRQARSSSVRAIVSNDHLRMEVSLEGGVHVVRVPKLATVASMPLCPTLAGVIRRCPADLAHIHLPNPGAALAFLVSGHRGELVVTHHADTLGRKALRQLSDPFVFRLMQRASSVIVTSARYLRSSDELAPFRDKCRVIPLGIDVQEPSAESQTKSRDLRAQFGDRLILSVGRLVAYKGFDILIRAMKHIDARLLLIGDGPQAAELTALVNAEGLNEKITMMGRMENLTPYFDIASIFVLPSITRAEAFGLVQLEAMAAGVPVINTNVDSGAPEVSVDGETGLTVAPGDAASLAQAIRLLLERQDLRERFGCAGRAKVRTEFTTDLMAHRTMSLYREMLGRVSEA